MSTGQSKWGRWVAAVAVMVGLACANVALGKKVEEKVQSGGGDIVGENGGEMWHAEMKAEVGAQLWGLVEEAAKWRQDSLAEANPVLVAYEKLSREMQVWFGLFAALGAFFGLLLPVGAYLLQIKAVDRYEDRVEKAIQKEMEKVQKTFGQLQETVANTKREMDDKVQESATAMKEQMTNQIEEIWTEVINVLHFYHVNSARILLKQTGDIPDAKERPYAIINWVYILLLILQLLSRVRNASFVKTKLRWLSRVFDETKQKNVNKDALVKFGKDFKRTSAHYADAVADLRQRCPEEMEKLDGLLAECGIVIEETDCP